MASWYTAATSTQGITMHSSSQTKRDGGISMTMTKVTKATRREVLEENFGGEFRLPNGQLRTSVQRNP